MNATSPHRRKQTPATTILSHRRFVAVFDRSIDSDTFAKRRMSGRFAATGCHGRPGRYGRKSQTAASIENDGFMRSC